jgi:hypothetical protein
MRVELCERSRWLVEVEVELADLNRDAVGKHLRFCPSLRSRSEKIRSRKHVDEGVVAVLVVPEEEGSAISGKEQWKKERT